MLPLTYVAVVALRGEEHGSYTLLQIPKTAYVPLSLFPRFAILNSCFASVPYKFRPRLLRLSHYVVKRNTLKNHGGFFLYMHTTQVYSLWALRIILNCFLNAISRFHTLATLVKVNFKVFLIFFIFLQLALQFNPYEFKYNHYKHNGIKIIKKTIMNRPLDRLLFWTGWYKDTF